MIEPQQVPDDFVVRVPAKLLRQIGEYIQGSPTGDIVAGIPMSLCMAIEALVVKQTQERSPAAAVAPTPDEAARTAAEVKAARERNASRIEEQ